MKKTIAAVLGVLFCAAIALGADTPYMTIGQQLSSSVTLVDPLTNEAVCGGVIVAEDRVLTAKHCVNPVADGAVVKFIDGRVAKGVVIARAKGEDVALIAVETGDAPVAQIQRTVNAGDALCAIGAPYGLEWTLTCGVLSAKRPAMDVAPAEGSAWLQVDAPITSGNSGGGVFAVNGGLLGIVSWGFLKAGGLNFIVPIGDALRAVGL